MSEAHTESHLPTYTKVIVVLSAFTLIEFAIALNMVMPSRPDGAIGFTLGAGLLLALTAAKAWAVGWFFMHLKYDARLLRFIIVSPLVLATPMVVLCSFDAIQGYAG